MTLSTLSTLDIADLCDLTAWHPCFLCPVSPVHLQHQRIQVEVLIAVALLRKLYRYPSMDGSKDVNEPNVPRRRGGTTEENVASEVTAVPNATEAIGGKSFLTLCTNVSVKVNADAHLLTLSSDLNLIMVLALVAILAWIAEYLRVPECEC